MTLYEAIEAEQRRLLDALAEEKSTALSVSSANQMAEAQPTVVDITAMQCENIKVAQATNNIEHLERDLQDLNYLFELETRRAEQFRHAGDVNKEAKTIKTIMGIRDKIHKVENQIIKEKLTIAKSQRIVAVY
jgi:hypothetical protein